ncbi:MAG: hypothetical protein JNL98_04955 [Bryobacterales bacterium]|nr:hypothetical protein [Bryobacterales bacterium]
MKRAYQSPELAFAGKAQDVVLGIVNYGDDIDGYIFVREFEFLDDHDAEGGFRP